MTRILKWGQNLGLQAMRSETLLRLAIGSAATRDRSLVLMYHRIGPRPSTSLGLVPYVQPDLFKKQLEHLQSIGTIVSLGHLVEHPGEGDRIQFAITFDDDDSAYLEHAVPVLNSLGVNATFFLSGRSLHGLGEYWWEALEAAVAEHGLEDVCTRLGIQAENGRDLAARCEGTPLVHRFSEMVSTPAARPGLDEQGICILARAGMDIGFHTIHHPVLPRLSDADLTDALTDGRAELASAAGKPIEFLAYPHGRADPRVAQCAGDVGYTAAFTNLSYPVSPNSNAFLLGRWDTRQLEPDQFMRSLALRLMRPSSGPTR